MELPYRKFSKLRKASLIFLLVTSVIFISLCYPLLDYPLYLLKNFLKSSSRPSNGRHDSTKVPITEGCDLFSGEWVPDPDAPYYTNTTCWAIHDHQNCMKYGRPDTEFMKWRWKPHGCELPIFDPVQFLEIVRGKSMAFVGDSVGRNQMQSLICLLSKVSFPVPYICIIL
uniref:Uncharacterized protein n=1 Tax=Rhizophora mucronata TaxID=61149 RepID=A0A2P2QB51_RHIMU